MNSINIQSEVKLCHNQTQRKKKKYSKLTEPNLQSHPVNWKSRLNFPPRYVQFSFCTLIFGIHLQDIVAFSKDKISQKCPTKSKD